jgi:osmoprotectant transport system permease protein
MDPGAIVAWFLDPANWQGSNGVPMRFAEHVGISLVSVLIATAIALPLGLWTGHTNRGATIAVNVANIGRALPSLAILIGLIPILGLGVGTTVAALVLLAIPPILTNGYIGVREVDREVVESGRAMGMGELTILQRLELPISLPVLLTGIRTASVQVVATATLWALVAGGGLGRYIIDGFAVNDDTRIVAGALLVAALAIATELVFTAAARLAISPGLRGVPSARGLDAPAGPLQPSD